MSSILTCFDLRKAKDKSGNGIDISNEYEDFTTIRYLEHFSTCAEGTSLINQIASYKAPYQCSITPRSFHVSTMIKGAPITDWQHRAGFLR